MAQHTAFSGKLTIILLDQNELLDEAKISKVTLLTLSPSRSAMIARHIENSMEDIMTYRINASCDAGAVSVPVSSSDDAWAKADALASTGYRNIVIIDAGTGMPVKRKSAGSTEALCKPASLAQISGQGGYVEGTRAVRIVHAAAE